MSEIVQRDVVLDLGGRQRFYRGLSSWEGQFEGRYYCLDIVPNVDLDVVGDLLALPFASGVGDGVICHCVLEHVHDPLQAVREIHRVLKPGGVGYVQVPFLALDHGDAEMPDYYRFTRDGLAYMFREFSEVEIKAADSWLRCWIWLTLSLMGSLGWVVRLLAVLPGVVVGLAVCGVKVVEWSIGRIHGPRFRMRRGKQAGVFYVWAIK